MLGRWKMDPARDIYIYLLGGFFRRTLPSEMYCNTAYYSSWWDTGYKADARNTNVNLKDGLTHLEFARNRRASAPWRAR